jgi:hypothetical protein
MFTTNLPPLKLSVYQFRHLTNKESSIEIPDVLLQIMIKKTTVKTKHQRQFVLEFVFNKESGDEKSPVL